MTFTQLNLLIGLAFPSLSSNPTHLTRLTGDERLAIQALLAEYTLKNQKYVSDDVAWVPGCIYHAYSKNPVSAFQLIGDDGLTAYLIVINPSANGNNRMVIDRMPPDTAAGDKRMGEMFELVSGGELQA